MSEFRQSENTVELKGIQPAAKLTNPVASVFSIQHITERTKMKLNFYTQVATCVAKNTMSEAYVLVGDDAITALGDGHLTALLANLGEENLPPKDRLARDYNTLPVSTDVNYTDKAKGFISIDGVLVSFAVAKISNDYLRVHFTRVDAATLYVSTQERIANLERDVVALMKVAKLDSGK